MRLRYGEKVNLNELIIDINYIVNRVTKVITNLIAEFLVTKILIFKYKNENDFFISLKLIK